MSGDSPTVVPRGWERISGVSARGYRRADGAELWQIADTPIARGFGEVGLWYCEDRDGLQTQKHDKPAGALNELDMPEFNTSDGVVDSSCSVSGDMSARRGPTRCESITLDAPGGPPVVFVHPDEHEQVKRELAACRASFVEADRATALSMEVTDRLHGRLVEWHDLANDIAGVSEVPDEPLAGRDARLRQALLVHTEEMARESLAAGRLERERDEAVSSRDEAVTALAEWLDVSRLAKRVKQAQDARDEALRERDALRREVEATKVGEPRRAHVRQEMRRELDSALTAVSAWRARALSVVGGGTFEDWGGDDILWLQTLHCLATGNHAAVCELLGLAMGIKERGSLGTMLDRFREMAEEARQIIEANS